MKDNRFPNRIFTIFGVALFCIFVLALTSCENFLKGANVRSELAEAIEIANTNPVTYYVIADQGSGTVNPSQLRLKKKESFDIMFVPNDEWKFICWEVLDRDTDEVVENCISFKDATALETRGTILTSRENLYIHPKCIKLPAVISHTPSNNTEKNYANTPVIIDFNMELDEENFAEGGVFSNYDFITITFSSSPISDLFEKPVLSDNKASITLTPKADVLAKYIKEEKKAAYIDVVFGFKEETNILIGGQSTPMVSSQSFSVRFLPTTETDPPEEVEFYACRPDDKDKKYYIEKDILDDSDKIKQNRSKGKVYIYGKYSDEESGVKYVEVKEKQKSDTWEKLVVGTVYSKKYTSETPGATFITNGSNTEFFIEYELQSGTGAIQMDVTVYDSCMNAATVKSFTVIKVSSDNYYFTTGSGNLEEIHTFSVYNYWGMNNPAAFEQSGFSIDNYNLYHKTLFVTDLSEYSETDVYQLVETIYGIGNTIAKADFSIVCEYVDDSGTLVSGNFVHSGENMFPYSYWSCPLQNVAKVSGLEVLVRVTDDIGNSVEQTVKFLPEPKIVLEDNNGTIKPTLYYDRYYDTDYDTTDAWFIETNNESQEKTYHFYCPTIKEGYTYQVIPKLNNLIGEISETTFTKGTGISESDPIDWAEDGDPKYSLGTQEGQLLATIKIATDSWDAHDIIYCYVPQVSPCYFWFSKNQTTMTIPIETSTAYSQDINFTLYGINGNGISGASTTKELEKLKNNDPEFYFDNTYPTISLTQNRYDLTVFTLSDSESGPLSASIIKPDGKEYFIVQAPEHRAYVNPWIFNEYGSTVIVKDKKGNTTTRIANIPAPAECKIKAIIRDAGAYSSTGTGGHLICQMQGQYNVYTFHYYKWENGDWTPLTSSSGINYLDAVDNTNSDFVKIEYRYKNISWSTPQYFYVKRKSSEDKTLVKNSGQFDYIEPFNDESVFVTSDAPAYVETIITTKPYDECKNWTTEEWERYHRNEKGEYFPFEASANPTRRKYNIPLDLINPGECYIIIAHFADGTSFKTEVRQK